VPPSSSFGRDRLAPEPDGPGVISSGRRRNPSTRAVASARHGFVFGPEATVFVARYSPPFRSRVSERVATMSHSRMPGTIASSKAPSIRITISPLRSNSAISSSVLTSRAARVAGAASMMDTPARSSASSPGVPRRSSATRSPRRPSSCIAEIVSAAHPAASSFARSVNSHERIGRTSAAARRDRWIEFGCSNRIGVPSAGTSAHRTNVLMLQTGIADAPVAYRTFGSLNRRQTSTSRWRIASWRRSSRPVRSARRSIP